MAMIFLSHSSLDNTEAKAMHDWLVIQGWDEVFLDLDPVVGLAPGQRWRDELRKAGENCSAVIVLISSHWAASKWCLTEFLSAAQLGKEIFPVMISPCSSDELPGELQSIYQIADISTSDKLEQGYECLRIGLQRAGLHPGAFRWPPANEPNRPPFRGLRVLEEPDAAIFFGRDTHITKALDAIRQMRDGAPERMLAILGASGAGKSSFLRAGLLARLKRDIERFLVLPTLRPGIAPLTGPTGLSRALGLNGPLNSTTISNQLAKLRAQAIQHFSSLPLYSKVNIRESPIPPPTVILPIDQAEELFVSGDEEAAEVIVKIVEVVEADPNLLIILTIRSDSFALLQNHSLLSQIQRLPFDLPRLPNAALKEIIQGPTRLAGVDITIDPDLTEQLIADFEGGDALPLLAFTLERLIIDHCTSRQLSKSIYLDEMKGVGGAIRKAVEIAFARAAEQLDLPKTRAELDRLAQKSFVPGLVRIDDSAAEPKRRVALRSRLPQEALPLIDQFVDQRLLVTDTEGTETTIEVSHEAVLRHWLSLASWIAERREDLILLERVNAAAFEWQVSEGSTRVDALVHRGERLRAAEKLLGWEDLGWAENQCQAAYLAACKKEEARQQATQVAQKNRQQRLRNLVTGLVAAGAIITLSGTVLLIKGQRNLGRTQSLMLARTAERLAAEGDLLHATHLSILAAQSNWLQPLTPEARVALYSNAQALKLTLEIRGHIDRVKGALFSKTENRILSWSYDGTARLWNAKTGKQIGKSLQHKSGVLGANFSKDESRILTWSDDGTARLWNANTGKQIGKSFQHKSGVLGANFSKDESRILTWSDDGTARLWNANTGKQIRKSLQHDHIVWGAVFSKDESRILTWSQDKTAKIWDATTGDQIGQSLSHEGAVSSAVFSNDNSRILTCGGDNTARIWNATTGEQVGITLRHYDWVNGAVFFEDGNRILTWSRDKNARIWNASTGKLIGIPLKHEGAVVGAILSKDENRILTWSDDGTARLWDATTGEQIGKPFKNESQVSGASFSEDERYILTWMEDKNTIRLWNSAAGEQIGTSLQHDDRIYGAVFSKDVRSIMTWSADSTARLWDADTGMQIGRSIIHEKAINGALFLENESRILTWSDDTTARIWNATTGEQIGKSLQHEKAINGALFLENESRILTWSDDTTARIWNATTGEQIGKSLQHEKETIDNALFSNDGSRILTWSLDGTARLWDANTLDQISKPLQSECYFNCAEFSKDGSRILTWGHDTSARIWNATTGEQIGKSLQHEKETIDNALFSNDGSRILTWSKYGSTKLWDTVTLEQIGKPLQQNTTGAVFSNDGSKILTLGNTTIVISDAINGKQISKPLKHDDNVTGAVFSKENSRILTWSEDKTARLWDTATGEQIGQSFKHDDHVTGAVFSKDNSRILTWSKDKTARIWDAHWAMRYSTDLDFVQDLCREKLVEGSGNVHPVPSGPKVTVGVRHIDTIDTDAAPILRGREGEDVCTSPPANWKTLMTLLWHSTPNGK